jgi:hypothetical protein
MNLIGSIVEWKQYVRNRLLALLRRAGEDAIFKPLNIKDDEGSIASLVSRMDARQESIFCAIQKHAFGIPDQNLSFGEGEKNRIPVDQGAAVFSSELHFRFEMMIDFISGLKEDDLDRTLEHPGIGSRLTAGWLIQYTTFREQEMVSEIQAILESNGIASSAPWASQSYLHPVQKLGLK